MIMRKFISLTFLLFFSTISFSQKTKRIEAEILLKDSNELVKKEIELKTIFLSPNRLDPRTVVDMKRIWLKRKKNDFIFTNDIDYITFIDLKGNNRAFSSIDRIKKIHQIGFVGKLEKEYLLEEVIVDSLSWYKNYNTNGYDNSLVTLNYYVLDGEIRFINELIDYKKQFKELVARFPTVVEMVDQKIDKYLIIKKYNELLRRNEN